MRDEMRGWFDRHPWVRATVLAGFIVLSLVLIPRAFRSGEPLGGVLLLLGLPAFGYSLVELLRTGSLRRGD